MRVQRTCSVFASFEQPFPGRDRKKQARAGASVLKRSTALKPPREARRGMGWRVQGLEGGEGWGGRPPQARPSQPASETVNPPVNPPVNPGRINNVPPISRSRGHQKAEEAQGGPCGTLGRALGSRLLHLYQLGQSPRPPSQTD